MRLGSCSFHYYDPLAFTGQGLSWLLDGRYRYLTGLTWPYDSANAQGALANALGLVESATFEKKLTADKRPPHAARLHCHCDLPAPKLSSNADTVGFAGVAPGLRQGSRPRENFSFFGVADLSVLDPVITGSRPTRLSRFRYALRHRHRVEGAAAGGRGPYRRGGRIDLGPLDENRELRGASRIARVYPVRSAMKKRTIVVNDRMQRGYRYLLTEPMGKNFDPTFKPELTPKQMLKLGVFGGKYMTDATNEFPSDWFAEAKLSPGRHDASLHYFGLSAAQPLSVWRGKGWIYARRSQGLVSMVLPLLFRSPHRRGRCAPDQTMESNAPPHSSASEELREARFGLPSAATTGASPVGLRQ